MPHQTSAPLPDDIFAEIARIDLRVDAQRQLTEKTEFELFCKPQELSPEPSDGSRKNLILSIALRDELIEELLARRHLLSQLL